MATWLMPSSNTPSKVTWSSALRGRWVRGGRRSAGRLLQEGERRSRHRPRTGGLAMGTVARVRVIVEHGAGQSLHQGGKLTRLGAGIPAAVDEHGRRFQLRQPRVV